jgi:hypothetical protein
MLNKGPFVLEAVATLENILGRMEGHQSKKRAMLRPLHVAHAVTLDLSMPPIQGNRGLGDARDAIPANT